MDMQALEQNEIIEGNRLIAVFDGYREIADYDGYEYAYTLHPTIDVVPIGDVNLRYHSSWDWIMPVLRKIKDWLNGMRRPSVNHCCTGDSIEVDIQCALWSIDIKKTFAYAVAWIKWQKEFIANSSNAGFIPVETGSNPYTNPLAANFFEDGAAEQAKADDVDMWKEQAREYRKLLDYLEPWSAMQERFPDTVKEIRRILKKYPSK